MGRLRTKRVLEAPEREDGYRMLIGRLWPRGAKKRGFSTTTRGSRQSPPRVALRRWFGHDPDRFEAFAERYRQEIEGNEEVERLAEIAAERLVTLLYAATDREHNHARVLADTLEGRLANG